MLAEGLLTLAAQAGWTVVTAADTDAWDTARRGFGQLLGQGDPEQTKLAERRLDETRGPLAGAAGAQREEVRTTLAERWAGRLTDLMEEYGVAEADLRALVKEVHAALPTRMVSAFDHAVSAEKDINIKTHYGEDVTQAIYWGQPVEPDQTVTFPRIRNVDLSPEETASNLAAQVSLALWIGEAGNAPAARDQFAALLPACERVLGPEHPDMLAARGELAYWMGQAGDASAARDQFAALVPVCERVLGPEHPETLAARGELAYWTGQAGDASAARDQFAALVPVCEQVLGPEHPDTLTGRHNLANYVGHTDDAAGARISSPRSCRSANASPGQTIPIPSPPGLTSPTGPAGRETPRGLMYITRNY